MIDRSHTYLLLNLWNIYSIDDRTYAWPLLYSKDFLEKRTRASGNGKYSLGGRSSNSQTSMRSPFRTRSGNINRKGLRSKAIVWFFNKKRREANSILFFLSLSEHPVANRSGLGAAPRLNSRHRAVRHWRKRRSRSFCLGLGATVFFTLLKESEWRIQISSR